MESFDHCDSCNDDKKSFMAGWESSMPVDWRRNWQEDFTAEKISVGGGRGKESAAVVILRGQRVPRGKHNQQVRLVRIAEEGTRRYASCCLT